MAKHFGVAETDIEDESFGTINLLTQLAGGGARGKEIALAAIAGAKSLSPEPEKVDAAQLAIRFFSQMGANAAQPGSTALSAAASALPSAADYLAQVNKRNREIERARGPLAIQLATAMKPPTAGTTTSGSYKLNKDIDGVGKAGDIVTLSTADALLYAKADPSALLKYTKPTSTGAAKAYSVTEEKLSLLNKELGLNLTRNALGNVLLTSDQFTLGQNFVGPEVKEDTSSSKPTILKLYDSLKDYEIGTDQHEAVLLEIKALQNKAGFDKDKFGAEKDLRAEWNKVNLPYAEVRGNYLKLKAALEPEYDADGNEITTDKKGVGDMAAVFLFMKMLDPGSVVRESEFKAAQGTAGAMDQLAIKIEQLKEGSILSADQRKDFLKLAKSFLDASIDLKNKTRLNLGQAVDNYSLTPQNIFGVETAPPWFYLNPDVFNSANKKNTTIDAMWKNMTEEEREAYSPSSGEK
jgi:hypothetical protein